MSRDRFDDELRSVIHRAVPREAPDRLRDRVLDATELPVGRASRFSFAWRVAAGVTAVVIVLVVAYAGYDFLRGTTPAPATSPSPSGVASASPQPTPFVPAAWELRSLPAPPGHPDFVVQGTSPDGSVVLFGDAAVYDHLYVERDGQVSEINLPGHESGSPLAGRLSPSGAFAVVEDANHLYRYDVASAQTTAIAGPPGVTAIDTFAFTSESSLAALTGPIIGPTGGGPTNTQLWVLNLATGDWARQGDRHDAVWLMATDVGPVLVVDTSAAHDNSGWHLYLAQPDGSDTLLYDASGSGYVAVSPDGRYVALSKEEGGIGGSSVVEVAPGNSRHLSDTGTVESFSPDGQQIEIQFADGHAQAFALNGSPGATVAQASQAAWIGVAPSPSTMSSPSPVAATPWSSLRWSAPATISGIFPYDVVAWHGGYVAVGQGSGDGGTVDPVATSTDGVHWTTVDTGSSFSDYPIRLAATPSHLIAIGNLQLPAGCPQGAGAVCTPAEAAPVWTSTDARTWTRIDPQVFGAAYFGMIAAGPQGAVIEGQTVAGEPRLWFSPDGARWQRVSLPSSFAQAILDNVAATPQGFMAVGRVGQPDYGSGGVGGYGVGVPAAWWSADGLTWQEESVQGVKAAGAKLDAIAVGANGLLATGSDDTNAPRSGAAWVSTDGKTWRRVSSESNPPCWDMTADGQHMVCIGDVPPTGSPSTDSVAAWVSTDGLTWNRLSLLGDVNDLPAGSTAIQRYVVAGDGVVVIGSQGASQLGWFADASGS
jgi:hypothetical protein